MDGIIQKFGTIGIHILAWILVILFCNTQNWYWQGYAVENATLFWPSIYGSFFNAVIFYTNAHWLYPRRKIFAKKYIPLAILLILVASFLEGLIDSWYIQSNPILREENIAYLEELGLPHRMAFIGNTLDMTLSNSFFHIAYFFVAFAYVLPIQELKNKRLYEALEREKVVAELKYLKAQINPHFLFNGINSVYHLIDQDTNLAKQTLHKFSGLLRYQLYECSEDEILLEKEIAYLEDYLAMERIRRGDVAEIEFTVENEEENLKIAPLLLTPFVENAFKYLSAFEDKTNFVYINLKATELYLDVRIENTYEAEIVAQKSTKSKGIGIENVKKRLALLYPKKHQLKITETEEVFSVCLHILF